MLQVDYLQNIYEPSLYSFSLLSEEQSENNISFQNFSLFTDDEDLFISN
jgi:hypothetical protein